MPGRGRVPALGLVLQHLDDLVAVARLLGDQGERQQAKVALRQHAAGAHHVAAVAAHAVASAAVMAVMPAEAAVAADRVAVFAMRSEMPHSKHLKFLLWVLRYIFR